MTETQLNAVCNGNAEAADFLIRWAQLADKVDNLVDGDEQGPEALLAAFVQCVLLTSHPFYLEHLQHLRAVLLVSINMYADSVAWERDSAEWKQRFADCYRHAGNEVVVAVAQLCGGYEHARKFSLEQRERCHATQHPEKKG